MSQDNAGVGIDLQQGVQGHQVAGRFEDPPFAGGAPLEMLKEAAVKLVFGTLVLAVMPGPVARHMAHGFETVTAEVVAGNGDTFLGQAGVN